MQYLGRTGDWAAYERAGLTVFVNVITLDVTDPLEGALVAAGDTPEYTQHPEIDSVEITAREAFIGPSVFADAGPGDERLVSVPRGVRVAASRALQWHRIYSRGGNDAALATAKLLSSHDKVSVQRLRKISRSLPQASDFGDNEGWKAGQTGFPSANRITWDLFGGDDGARWVNSQIRRADRRTLIASVAFAEEDIPLDEAVETDSAPGNEPHAYHPSVEQPNACMFCLNSPDNEIHDDAAVDYLAAEVNPQWAHLFDASAVDEELCRICEGDETVWQHVHAAAAQSILRPTSFEFHSGLLQDPVELTPVTATALPDADRMAAITAAVSARVASALHADTDYYVTIDSADSMLATGLFQQTKGEWYEWNALSTTWLKSQPAGPVYLVDVDYDTAEFVLQGLQEFTGGVDLRLADPEEYALHDSCLSDLDWEFIDTLLSSRPEVAIVAAGADADYTPEERAENASKQVRDRNGRFAKTGTQIYLPDGTPAKVSKIHPDTGELTAISDIDGTETRIKADEVEVRQVQLPTRIDLDKIRAIPRATRITPKAWAKNLLPPLNSDALKRIFEDYAKFIDDELGQVVKPLNAAAGEAVETQGVMVYDSIEDLGVPPIYMALVDKDDHEAILDMVAIIPATKEGGTVQTVRRTDLGWEIDPTIKDELLSSVPPPVVALQGDQVAEVEAQVTEWYSANASADPGEASLYDLFGNLTAAGGSDRNRGGAEELRRYWLSGKGAAKIRWNTPGDWKRCYSLLSKYMGPRAKGYCSLRHKEATGSWPGSKNNIGNRKRFSNTSQFFTAGDLFDLNTVDDVLTLVASAASFSDEYIPEIASEVDPEAGGLPFLIPIVAPVNIESGDGRVIHPMALSYRDLPLPLMWQIKTGAGHDGAVVVGRIDSIDVLPSGGLGNARGVFDINPYAREAQRMVEHGFLRGVSVDLDKFRAVSKMDPSESAIDGETRISNDRTEIEEGRVMGITIVPKPAFQECHIQIDTTTAIDDGEVPLVADGTYAGLPDSKDEAEALVAAALIAAGIPVNPPSSWFTNPQLRKPTPLTVSDDGRVFGHVATWRTDHIGLPFATKPPRSRSNYAYFHTGTLHADDGDLIPVGQITLAGGHAPLNLDAASAAAHYDNTRSAWCDVHAGEDEFGIWVAGALRPSVTPENVRAIRASAPSGDWRPISGRLEMVAVCSVNVPGFPVTQATVASGALVSLVAAGTVDLLEARKSSTVDGLDALAARIERLEAPQRARLESLREAALDRRAETVRDRFSRLAAATTAESVAFATQESPEGATDGSALPDGTFRIQSLDDLTLAIRAFGQAADKSVAKAHIIQRAVALGETAALPPVWHEVALTASAALAKGRLSALGARTLSERAAEVQARMSSFAKADDFDPKRHPRDEHGKFRGVLARLKTDLSEVVEGDEEAEKEKARKIQEVEEIEGNLTGGDLDAAKIAGARLLHNLDLTDTEIGDARLAERLRDDYTLLGDVVYNIGVPVGADDALRYSELPPVLQTLIEDLVAKIEAQEPADEKGETAKAVLDLKSYISGDDQLKQNEISAALSKLVRLLV
jgi:hypothetical protein